MRGEGELELLTTAVVYINRALFFAVYFSCRWRA